eukprot:17391-Heterococcus_DN1.PRE.3
MFFTCSCLYLQLSSASCPDQGVAPSCKLQRGQPVAFLVSFRGFSLSSTFIAVRAAAMMPGERVIRRERVRLEVNRKQGTGSGKFRSYR